MGNTKAPTASAPITSDTTAPVAPMKLNTLPPNSTASMVGTEASTVAQAQEQKSAEQLAYEQSKSDMAGLAEQYGGKTAEGLSLAESTGLNQVNKQISTNNAEILALQNATNQEKERLTKVPGMTQAGLQGLYSDLDNRNAFKITNLQMANAFASINSQALQKTIETQLALKYEPLEAKLEIAKMNYQDNKDFFTKAEQRQYETKVRQEEQKIDQQKTDDANKFALLTKAMENGVQIPANLLSQINDPKTDSKKAASILAGAGISLENALDRKIKLAQLNKLNVEASGGIPKIKKINGIDMQWDETTKTWKKVTADESNELRKDAIKAKLNILDNIASSGAISSAVGPTALARTPKGFFKNVGLAATFVGLPSVLVGTYDKVTGRQQNFIADVEQLVSKEFLDSLIDVKAQGATFGALQKAEQDALTQAATKIGRWRVETGKGEDKKVVGYNASEKDFLREISTIRNLAQKAYERSGGGDMESSYLDTIDQSLSANIYGDYIQ